MVTATQVDNLPVLIRSYVPHNVCEGVVLRGCRRGQEDYRVNLVKCKSGIETGYYLHVMTP
jgi:hypothetical protein